MIEQHNFAQNKGITSDETIELVAKKYERCQRLRRICYVDKEHKDGEKVYVFVTNNFKLSARTIADIYKSRWEVELFFKWIKQNLKIKSFIGVSKNAVMTQIWIAMCAYLIVNVIKIQSKTTKTMRQVLRLLNLNLFEKKALFELVNGKSAKLPNIEPLQLISKGI